MNSARDFIIGAVALGASLITGGSVDKIKTPSEIQLSMHETFHYPEIEGKKIEAVPYLTLPFRKKDLSMPYEITEGWIYSAPELKIHKQNLIHAGIDYHVPYGTIVVAPVDGYAISSYHTSRVKDSSEKDKFYQGRPVNLGLGYFVRIYVPSVNRVVEMAHLSDIDLNIPFSMPERTEDGWKPTNHDLKPDEWANSPFAVFVKRGTPIGKVGYSGLTWGYEEYQEGAKRPVQIDTTKFNSWDEPHLHFDEFARNPKTNELSYQRDPYGIYGTFDLYPTEGNKRPLGKDPLFFLNKDGLPKYADDP